MKRKKRIGIIFIIVACYIAMVCLPYVKQGGVTAETEAAFQQSDFYGDHATGDRASILFQPDCAVHL